MPHLQKSCRVSYNIIYQSFCQWYAVLFIFRLGNSIWITLRWPKITAGSHLQSRIWVFHAGVLSVLPLNTQQRHYVLLLLCGRSQWWTAPLKTCVCLKRADLVSHLWFKMVVAVPDGGAESPQSWREHDVMRHKNANSDHCPSPHALTVRRTDDVNERRLRLFYWIISL